MKMKGKQLYECPKSDDYVIIEDQDKFILGKFSGIVIDRFFTLSSTMRYLESIKNNISVWFQNQDGSYVKAEMK